MALPLEVTALLSLDSNIPSSSLGPISIGLNCPVLLTSVETQYAIKGNGHLLKI